MHLRVKSGTRLWLTGRPLKSGDDAVFDKELTFEAKDIEPRITYGFPTQVWVSALPGNIPTR